MMKKCYVLNGQIINVGEWDYQKYTDEEGNEVVGNPLPQGAIEVEKDMEYSEEYGWREAGWTPQPTETEMLMDYIVDVDYRIVLLELGLIQKRRDKNEFNLSCL